MIKHGIQNSINGLAIGASFTESVKLGVSTWIAIICYELLNDLEKYSFYVKYGFTHKQSVLANLFSNAFCYIGFYISVAIASSFESFNFWIFSITTGIFFYVSLVDLVRNIVKRLRLCNFSFFLF
jgi:zinc transporter ZupT